MAAPKGDSARLHIGIDTEKIIVGTEALKMYTGRARRRRWGCITEVAPTMPSGRTHEVRVRSLSQFALLLLMLSAVLTSAGLPWWTTAAGTALMLVLVSREQARAATIGVLAMPPVTAGAHVLYARPERDAFERTFTVAKRIQRTWPALAHMIDRADAELMLARALHDLAGVLSHRQQLRRLRDELAAVDYHDLPADSAAVESLLEQRTQVEILWREAGAVANRHMASIGTAAAAGENLAREQQVGQTARDAQRALTRLAATVTPEPSAALRVVEAGQELADRTAAVIDAYRELAARYGRAV